MNKRKILSYAVAAILASTAASCEKKLDEFNPHSATAENLWATPSGFTSMVNSAYSELHLFFGQEDGFFLQETGSDLWYSAGRLGYARQIVGYDGISTTQSQPTKAWTSCYKSINLCNAGIGRIDKAGYAEAEKKQRLGELYFLRAYYNWVLVEQFGGVILRTTESADGINFTPTRSKPEEFYDVILSDLAQAKELLPNSWPVVEYSRATKKSAMGLLARVLLSRAYYSTGAEAQSYFSKAKDAALEVINNQSSLGLSLFANAAEIGQSVYGTGAKRAANKEAMFTLSYDETNAALNALTGVNGNKIFKYGLLRYSGRPGMSATFVNAYGSDGESRVMPTWHLLDLFDETKDARYAANFQEVFIANSAWTWAAGNIVNTNQTRHEKDASVIGQTIAVGDTAIFVTKGVWGGRKTRKYIETDRNELYINPQPGQGAAIVAGDQIPNWYPSFKKFVNQTRTFAGTTDFGDAMIIRLSEMYLIAGEAYVQLNDKTNAAKYVNEVRKRRAIPGKETAMEAQPSDMNIEYILDERGREFAGELHRWYDLKRVFRGQDFVDYIKKFNPDQVTVTKEFRLRPIPQNELNALLNAKEFGQNPGYL